jgi:hypothetical protein
MAITGSFLADFASFTTACTNAEVSLKGFEGSSAKVETQLNRMTDSLSGVKIVQQATIAAQAVETIGGVSRLTEAELARVGATATEAAAKLRALGQDVPAGIQKIADAAKDASASTSKWGSALSTASGFLGAFGIQASLSGVVSFTKSVFDSASAIHDMAERLGISSEAVQGFKFAAEQAGSSMDAVGSAVTKMNKNLAEGDKSTIAALKSAGLEFQTVRAMKPEEAFLAIADAIAKMPDPMEQSDVTLKLFGKSAAELLPAIKEGFRGAAEGAQKMSNDTVDALEKAQDAWDKLGHSVTIVSGTIIAGAIDATHNVTSSWKDFGIFISNVATMGWGAATALAAMNDQVQTPVDFVGPLESLAGHIHQTKEEAEAAEQAYKKWAEATGDLAHVGDGWAGTLDTIDGNVVEAIRYYLAAGVAQDKLATAYGLTAAQVKSVASALTAEAEGLKVEAAALALQVAQAAQLTKVTDEHYRAVNAASHDSIAGRINDAYLAAESEIAAMEKSKNYSVAAEMEIWAAADQTATNIIQKNLESDRYTKEHYQKIADDAKLAYEFALDHASSYARGEVDLLREKSREAAQASHYWRSQAEEDMEKVSGGAVKAAAAVSTIGDVAWGTIAPLQAMGRAAEVALGKLKDLGNGYSQLTSPSSQQTYDLSTPEGMAYYQAMNPQALVKAPAAYFQSHTLEQAIQQGAIDIHGNDPMYLGDRQVSAAMGGAAGSAYTLAMQALKARTSTSWQQWVDPTAAGPVTPPALYAPPNGSVLPPSGGGGGATFAPGAITIHVNGTAEEVAAQVSDQILRTVMRGTQLG